MKIHMFCCLFFILYFQALSSLILCEGLEVPDEEVHHLVQEKRLDGSSERISNRLGLAGEEEYGGAAVMVEHVKGGVGGGKGRGAGGSSNIYKNPKKHSGASSSCLNSSALLLVLTVHLSFIWMLSCSH